MAEVLMTENPFLPGEPIPEGIEIYEDNVADVYIVKDKSTGEVSGEFPRTYPPPPE
jgi:hypothetical protein